MWQNISLVILFYSFGFGLFVFSPLFISSSLSFLLSFFALLLCSSALFIVVLLVDMFSSPAARWCLCWFYYSSMPFIVLLGTLVPFLVLLLGAFFRYLFIDPWPSTSFAILALLLLCSLLTLPCFHIIVPLLLCMGERKLKAFSRYNSNF